MNKFPSVRPLSFSILVTIVLTFSLSYTSRAYFLDLAKEYRLQADKFQIEGRLDQAVEYYRKAVGLDGNCVAAYNNLAICYEKKGQLSQAEKWYLKALEVVPQYAPAHYNLGLFYERAGDIEMAVFHWKKRLRLSNAADPARIKLRAKLKQYAFEQLKVDDARALARSMIEQREKEIQEESSGKYKYRTKEDQIQEYYLEGMEFYLKGEYQEAGKYFHEMIDALPVSN